MSQPKRDETIKCQNCGKRIVEVNFALGKRWVHQPAGAAFQDKMYTYCKITVAMPRIDSEARTDDHYPGRGGW